MHRICGAVPDRSPSGWPAGPAGPVSKSAGNPLSGVNAFSISLLSRKADDGFPPPADQIAHAPEHAPSAQHGFWYRRADAQPRQPPSVTQAHQSAISGRKA